MFCQMLEEELEEQTRIVAVSEHFVALELYASPAPFSTDIYPRRHIASFGDVSAAEMNSFQARRPIETGQAPFLSRFTVLYPTTRTGPGRRVYFNIVRVAELLPIPAGWALHADLS
jgi:hypothetical protein